MLLSCFLVGGVEADQEGGELDDGGVDGGAGRRRSCVRLQQVLFILHENSPSEIMKILRQS